MDRLIVLTKCDDNTCCCLSPRSSAALISVIGLVACLLDVLSNDSNSELICGVREHVISVRNLLNTLFQMANMLLLLGSIVDRVHNFLKLTACFYPVLLGIYLLSSLMERRANPPLSRKLQSLGPSRCSNVIGRLHISPEFSRDVQESALLLQIYLWYMLGFIVVGFVVAILDFCFRIRDEGVWSFATFVPEVVFLFVIFRCLPLVDTYKRRLEGL